MTQYYIFKYTAIADHVPDNLYAFACSFGTEELIWGYNDLEEAMLTLSAHESTCEPDGDKYKVTCYALETMEV